MSEPPDWDSEWPIVIGTPEQQAKRADDLAATRETRQAAARRLAEDEAVAERARLELSGRDRKRVTEDAAKKIRRDQEREQNVPEPQRNLRAITALRMRRNGASDKQIARALGYKSPSSVSTLIGDALRSHAYDQHEVEVYRDYFLAELINQAEIAVETIRNPGYLYDVKGELVTGPDGEFLANISERTKAQTEWRHIQESARKLLGVDAPQKKIRKNTIIIKNIREAAQQLGIQVDDETGLDIVEADVIDALPPGNEANTPAKARMGTAQGSAGWAVHLDDDELRDRQEGGEKRDERGRFDPRRADTERPQQREEDRGDEADEPYRRTHAVPVPRVQGLNQ